MEVQVASLVDSYGHDGDESGFDVLYRTHGREVQRLAARLLRNTTDAEDASQTVFLNVLRALRQGVRPAEPRAWILSITRNVCFSRRRATSARPEEVELDPDVVAHAAVVDAPPRTDDIVGALARMLPNQRTALILRDFRGVPRNEIANLLDLSPVGVETLLTRARTSFREELEAGDSPLDCADTRALVEQQLAGLISVAERHTLRTHLRHCGPCSTLARKIRSSAGKLASLFWPSELLSRLAAALSQAPAAHVVGAVASSALVASVAVPLALHGVPATSDSASSGPASPVPVAHHVVAAPAHAAPAVVRVVRTHAKPAAATHPVAPHKTVKAAPHHAVKATHVVSRGPIVASAPVTHTVAATRQSPAIAPTAAPVRARPVSTPPTTTGGNRPAPSPSASPAARPSGKPAAKPRSKEKAKPARTRHAPSPIERMPPSEPPVDNMAPSGGAEPTGPGFTAEGDQSAMTMPALSTQQSPHR